MTRSPKQRERQHHRNNGKYAKVNPCQGCGKSAGVEYFSHYLTDVGDWNDEAICLCKKYAEATQDMVNVEEFWVYQIKNGGDK